MLAATVGGYALGAVYYMTLSKPWLAATGLPLGPDGRPVGGDNGVRPFIIGFICTLLVAGMMRHIFTMSALDTPIEGIMGGFGIGAFEARELVRAAKGRLDVESREGLGTRFIIRLPLATTAELLSAAIVTEFNNKPYMLTDEELAALNPLGQATQTEATTGEATNVDITPEDVAAAIAVCTGAAESSTYSLSFGQSLDLTTVLKDMSFNGIVKGLEQVDMATDTSANVVSLTLADVLSMPPTNGVYQLVLSGAANDKVMLTEGEWTDTGTVVNQNGHNYAVYSGTTDPSAQLLIDQHMLQSHQTS